MEHTPCLVRVFNLSPQRGNLRRGAGLWLAELGRQLHALLELGLRLGADGWRRMATLSCTAAALAGALFTRSSNSPSVLSRRCSSAGIGSDAAPASAKPNAARRRLSLHRVRTLNLSLEVSHCAEREARVVSSQAMEARESSVCTHCPPCSAGAPAPPSRCNATARTGAEKNKKK